MATAELSGHCQLVVQSFGEETCGCRSDYSIGVYEL